MMTSSPSDPIEEHHVKASPAEQQELLRLQSLDTRLQQLAHRLGALPQAATLAELASRDTAVRGTRAEAIGGLEDARAELGVLSPTSPWSRLASRVTAIACSTPPR